MKNFSRSISFMMIMLLTIVPLIDVMSQSQRQLRRSVNKSAMKEARKESRKLSRQGYKVTPGQLSIAKQLENAWMMQYERDDNGDRKFYFADAVSVAETHAAAKLQAYELAKINLAGQIETSIAGLVTTNVGNQQLSGDEAASVTQTMGQFKSKLDQRLGRIITAFEAYKPIGKNTEVMLTLAYSAEEANRIAREILREDLLKLGKLDKEKINKLLEF